MSESNNSENSSTSTNTLFQIFKDSNIVIIVWFLAVYFVVYMLLNIIKGKEGAKSSMSKWIDIVFLLCALVYLSTTYFAKTTEEKQEIVSDMYSGFKSYLDNYSSIVSTALFIFILYVVIYILGLPMDSAGKPITISLIENIAWLVFVIVLFVNFLHYVLGISVTSAMDEIGDYLQKKAEDTDTSGNKNEENAKITGNGNAASSSMNGTIPVVLNEVFNIGNNMFTYDDAQTVCASFGARLATYDEVEDAYNKGGEWCNYGWSEGQAAYFPTQKSTWQRLQKSKSTQHSCGRPGINGGYIDNPNVRFGVNCFGKKPKPSTTDLSALTSGQNIPKTPEEVLLEKKVAFWNANRDKLLKINGHNNKKWSMY